MKNIFRSVLLLCSLLVPVFSSGYNRYFSLFPGGILNHTVSPATISPVVSPAFPTHHANEFVNPVFDKGTGNHIFTVNGYGLYDASGTLIHQYFTGNSNCFDGIISEIEVVPVPRKCNTYKVLYWKYRDCKGGPNNRQTLWSQEVSWSAATGVTAASPVSLLNFVGTPSGWAHGYATLVADAMDSLGNRNFYSTVATSTGFARMYKFAMDASGVYSEPVIAKMSVPMPSTALLELNIIDTNKTISWGTDEFLILYDIRSATWRSIQVGPLGTHITGIEFVPTEQKYYIASYSSGGVAGGLSIVDPASSTTTPIPNTYQYRLSDLEMGMNDRLYFVKAATTDLPNSVEGTSGPATLSYLIPGSSSSTITDMTTQVENVYQRFYSLQIYYYIQNQVDIENYNNWYPANPQLYAGFVIDGQPRAGIGSPCIPHLACTNSLIAVLDNPLNFREGYYARIQETDACGAAIAGSVWSTPAGEWLNKNNYTYGATSQVDFRKAYGGLLTRDGAQGRYFLVTIYVTGPCTGTVHSSYSTWIQIRSTTIRSVDWTVEFDSYGSTGYGASNCNSGLWGCKSDPTISFVTAGVAGSAYYYMKINEYDDCLKSPIASFTGSLATIPSTALSMGTTLSSYVSTYCGGPTNYSPADGHHIGIELFYTDGCALVSRGERFFQKFSGCKSAPGKATEPGVEVLQGVATPLSATLDAKSTVAVYPNPARDNVSVRFSSKMGRVEYILVDIAGKVIVNASINILEGDQIIKIDTRQLASGLYQLKMLTDGVWTSTKVAVMH